jgi:predicted small metal-binding protein
MEFYKSKNIVVGQQSANEESARLFFVRCADVGLDCNCVIFGRNQKNIMDNTIMHKVGISCHQFERNDYVHEIKDKREYTYFILISC